MHTLLAIVNVGETYSCEKKSIDKRGCNEMTKGAVSCWRLYNYTEQKPDTASLKWWFMTLLVLQVVDVLYHFQHLCFPAMLTPHANIVYTFIVHTSVLFIQHFTGINNHETVSVL